LPRGGKDLGASGVAMGCTHTWHTPIIKRTLILEKWGRLC
jgi:hypothetical protein